jgi:Tfp pilus assembly PilM family ATPase
MVLDFQVIGEQMEAGVRQLAVLIVAAPREAVEARVALLSRAGVRLLSVVPDGIALANAMVALRSAEERAELAINIGRKDTLLAAVLPGDRTVSQVVRHVPGGLDLLDAGHSTDRIESRKRERAKDQWLQEIERSIQFAERKAGRPLESDRIPSTAQESALSRVRETARPPPGCRGGAGHDAGDLRSGLSLPDQSD